MKVFVYNGPEQTRHSGIAAVTVQNIGHVLVLVPDGEGAQVIRIGRERWTRFEVNQIETPDEPEEQFPPGFRAIDLE